MKYTVTPWISYGTSFVGQEQQIVQLRRGSPKSIKPVYDMYIPMIRMIARTRERYVLHPYPKVEPVVELRSYLLPIVVHIFFNRPNSTERICLFFFHLILLHIRIASVRACSSVIIVQIVTRVKSKLPLRQHSWNVNSKIKRRTFAMCECEPTATYCRPLFWLGIRAKCSISRSKSVGQTLSVQTSKGSEER